MEERHIVIRKDDEGYFIATCPSLKGCHSYGATLEEALDNIKEAYSFVRKSLRRGDVTEADVEL